MVPTISFGRTPFSLPLFNFKRKFMSTGINMYARMLLGLKSRDNSGSFRCYRVSKLERLIGPFTHDPSLRLNVAVALQVAFGDGFWEIQDFLVYGFFLVFGASAPRLVSHKRGWFMLGALSAVCALAVFVIAPPAGSVVNNSHVLHLLCGAAWVSLLERLAGRPTVGGAPWGHACSFPSGGWVPFSWGSVLASFSGGLACALRSKPRRS